jgi:hypothetical protein
MKFSEFNQWEQTIQMKFRECSKIFFRGEEINDGQGEEKKLKNFMSNFFFEETDEDIEKWLSDTYQDVAANHISPSALFKRASIWWYQHCCCGEKASNAKKECACLHRLCRPHHG